MTTSTPSFLRKLDTMLIIMKDELEILHDDIILDTKQMNILKQKITDMQRDIERIHKTIEIKQLRASNIGRAIVAIQEEMNDIRESESVKGECRYGKLGK